jgi:cytochrome c oxidase subunit 2
LAWKQFVTVPKDALVFEAVGQQWQWSFRFPGKNGVLGTANSRFVSADNPLGLNPADPYGRDDIMVEGSEVHLPRGRPIKVVLRSKDVLHDFFVPQIRARMDMVPGMVTYFWFTPTRTGRYEILCAELCGTGHYAMRGALVIDEEPAFEAWLNQQPTFGQLMAEAAQTSLPAAPSPTPLSPAALAKPAS